MRIELTRVGLLVYLANHYTTRGAPYLIMVSVKQGSVKFHFSKSLVLLNCHLQHHNNTTITTQWQRPTQEDYFTLLQGFEKGYSRFACEKEQETEQNWNILTPTLVAVNGVSFSFSRCSTGGPGVHSAGCWLSLLHLISNFSGPQTPSGFPRAPSAVWLSLPHLVYNSVFNCNSNSTVWLLSWPSYIIVQRPLDRPLDLWNRMFNRHQAEITVMQFRGHSLPVRQSMRVSWDFLACPILLANFSPNDFLS